MSASENTVQVNASHSVFNNVTGDVYNIYLGSADLGDLSAKRPGQSGTPSNPPSPSASFGQDNSAAEAVHVAKTGHQQTPGLRDGPASGSFWSKLFRYLFGL